MTSTSRDAHPNEGMGKVGGAVNPEDTRLSWLGAALEPFVPDLRRLAVLAAVFATLVGVLTHESEEPHPLLHVVAWACPMLLVALLTALLAATVAGAVHRRRGGRLGWALPFYAVHAASSCIAVPVIALYEVRVEREEVHLDPWLFIFIGAGLMAFGLLVNIWGVLHSRFEVQAEQLRDRDAQVGAAHELLIVNEEGIRRDVAEVLHGRVQSRLLALELKLGHLAEALPELHGATVDEITAHLRSLREDDVRRLSHSLHPSVIRLGLLPALNELAEEAERGLGLRVQVNVDSEAIALDMAGSPLLSDAARLTLYRAAEEAIVNAHRHGHAKNVAIELRPVDDCILLLVRDDGCGTAHDSGTGDRRSAGLGLSSVGLRVGANGGSMSLDHNAGAGMTLRVRLPLAPVSEVDVSSALAVAERAAVNAPVGRLRRRPEAPSLGLVS